MDFRPQLAVPLNKSLESIQYPVLAEPKLDGVRCICRVENNEPTFWSRDGKPFVNFAELEDEVRSLNLGNCILDGEIMASNGTFDSTISRARSHRGVNTYIGYKYHLFDYLDDFSDFSSSFYVHQLKERKTQLYDKVINNDALKYITEVPYMQINNSAELAYQHMVYTNLNYEGTMIKPIHSFYHQGRNQDWKKIKPFHTADLLITEMTEGTGKCSGMMGRLQCYGLLEDGRNVKCEVGTGFSDALRKHMWENQHEYLGKFCEVQYQEVTKDMSLRFPSFKRMRLDKE
jgi:DNA ligase-1